MSSVSSTENFTAPVDCERISQGINESTGCSFISWGMDLLSDYNGSCSAEAYTGSACRQQLLAWQACAIGQSEPIFLDLSFMEQSLKKRERDVSRFIHFLCKFFFVLQCVLRLFQLHDVLGNFGSDYCQRAASLLVCQSYYPLCDCESGHSYFASREQCERISMEECKKEWTNAKQYNIPLPNCTDLLEEVTSENYNRTTMMHDYHIFAH